MSGLIVRRGEVRLLLEDDMIAETILVKLYVSSLTLCLSFIKSVCSGDVSTSVIYAPIPPRAPHPTEFSPAVVPETFPQLRINFITSTSSSPRNAAHQSLWTTQWHPKRAARRPRSRLSWSQAKLPRSGRWPFSSSPATTSNQSTSKPPPGNTMGTPRALSSTPAMAPFLTRP